jgi:uncharacterized protein (DUF3820 family)
MPFGKHRGEALCDVPEEYLAWLVDDGLAVLKELCEQTTGQPFEDVP